MATITNQDQASVMRVKLSKFYLFKISLLFFCCGLWGIFKTYPLSGVLLTTFGGLGLVFRLRLSVKHCKAKRSKKSFSFLEAEFKNRSRACCRKLYSQDHLFEIAESWLTFTSWLIIDQFMTEGYSDSPLSTLLMIFAIGTTIYGHCKASQREFRHSDVSALAV